MQEKLQNCIGQIVRTNSGKYVVVTDQLDNHGNLLCLNVDLATGKSLRSVDALVEPILIEISAAPPTIEDIPGSESDSLKSGNLKAIALPLEEVQKIYPNKLSTGKHIFYSESDFPTPESRDTQHYRHVVEGGLAVCKLCGGAEGSLTTDCPGIKVPYYVGQAVYHKELDFRDGIWMPGIITTHMGGPEVLDGQTS